ncbi:uncharacterized protein VTP21DRAFT_5203 [Calcarisporiella thermophila]|uniref:uncharacterized protein n=1 Tax=Calcarisporiella thermophila TaxID=911321 RepID=UPI003744593C
MPSDNKKVVLITGGTDGIGFEAAKCYLHAGFVVVITGRDQVKLEGALDSLHALTQEKESVQGLTLDLSSFESIRTAVATFQELHLPLHVLINNASMICTEREFTSDTRIFEKTCATNFVGTFYLTHQLLPLLKTTKGRILTITSMLHDPNRRLPKDASPIYLFDPENLDGNKAYSWRTFYGLSKLLQLYHIYVLSSRLAETHSGVTCNAVSPGFVPATNLNRFSWWPLRWAMRNLFPWLISVARSAEVAGEEYLYYGTSEAIEGVSGKYFQYKEVVDSSEESYDMEKAKAAWNLACEATGIVDEKF